MNTPSRSRPFARRRAGFSLVEMIGVLAIIAILAVIIVPRVFSTIASSKITSTVASTNAMKTAVTDYFAKFGTVPVTGNNSRIDDLLVTTQILESRFTAKIGTQPGTTIVAGATWARNAAGVWTATGGSNQTGQSRVICRTSTTAAPSTAAGANYRLNGPTDLPAGSRVISAVLVNVTSKDAYELSQAIDSTPFSQAAPGTADNDGRVVYAAPNAAGLTTAYVYLAHQ